jgi:hypothetical protein
MPWFIYQFPVMLLKNTVGVINSFREGRRSPTSSSADLGEGKPIQPWYQHTQLREQFHGKLARKEKESNPARPEEATLNLTSWN